MLGAFCLLRVPSGGLEPEQAPRRAKHQIVYCVFLAEMD